MEPVVLLVASCAVVLTAGLVAATLRLESGASWALAVYLLASAEIVVLVEALSPVGAVSAGQLGLAVAAAAAAAAAAWAARGRPRPPRLRLPPRATLAAHPVLTALAAVVACGVAYELVLVLTTPPNNGDSLTYHLTRAAAWLREGGLHRIPGPATTAENVYPPNAEIQILFTFVFLGGDGAAAFPQFAAQAALVVAIYGCARRLGASAAASAFAALIAPTLSVFALQSVTTQNDLVVAAYVVVAAYFLRSGDPRELVLAGLAIGLALGTKFTAVFALPALALIAAVSAHRVRVRVGAAAAAAVACAAVGGYAYVRNLVESGSPFGELPGEIGGNRPSITPIGTLSSVVRNAYRFVDLSGYPIDAITYLRPFAGAARRAFDAVGLPANPPESTAFPFSFAVNTHANEDLSFFGPLGALLILPLVAIVPALAARGRASGAGVAHALALPLYLTAMALGYRYSGQGRFLITAVGLTLPVVALVYPRRRLAAAIAVVGGATLALAHAYNVMKPVGLAGTTAIWHLPPSKARTLNYPAELWYALEAIERRVPPDARIGTVVGDHDADYVLYGRRLQRALVPVPETAPTSAAAALGLRWIYVGRFARVPPPAPGWRAERLSDAGTLLERVGSPGIPAPPVGVESAS